MLIIIYVCVEPMKMWEYQHVNENLILRITSLILKFWCYLIFEFFRYLLPIIWFFMF